MFTSSMCCIEMHYQFNAHLSDSYRSSFAFIIKCPRRYICRLMALCWKELTVCRIYAIRLPFKGKVYIFHFNQTVKWLGVLESQNRWILNKQTFPKVEKVIISLPRSDWSTLAGFEYPCLKIPHFKAEIIMFPVSCKRFRQLSGLHRHS